MAKDGDLTGKVGGLITRKVDSNKYQVFYDHGESKEDNVGVIYVSLCHEVTRETQIGQLDIAIVKDEGNELVAHTLIEIEENGADPKKIVGDIFTFLLGNYVKFKKNGKVLRVNEDTTFLLLILGSNNSKERIYWIKENAFSMKKDMKTFNSKVGKIEIEFTQKKEEVNITDLIVNKYMK